MSRHTAQRRHKKEMAQFEKFVADGNEKADELAEAGAIVGEGFMAEARTKTMQQERKEVYAGLQYAVHCLVEEWRRTQAEVKSSEISWIEKERRRSIERSSVLKPTNIDR